MVEIFVVADDKCGKQNGFHRHVALSVQSAEFTFFEVMLTFFL